MSLEELEIIFVFIRGGGGGCGGRKAKYSDRSDSWSHVIACCDYLVNASLDIAWKFKWNSKSWIQNALGKGLNNVITGWSNKFDGDSLRSAWYVGIWFLALRIIDNKINKDSVGRSVVKLIGG